MFLFHPIAAQLMAVLFQNHLTNFVIGSLVTQRLKMDGIFLKRERGQASTHRLPAYPSFTLGGYRLTELIQITYF